MDELGLGSVAIPSRWEEQISWQAACQRPRPVVAAAPGAP